MVSRRVTTQAGNDGGLPFGRRGYGDIMDPDHDDPGTALDPEAEEARLDDLGKRIAATRKKAHEDLEGSGRTFADQGVRAQVEADGDTAHPPADRP